MDNKILEKANKINGQIQVITRLIEAMEDTNYYQAVYPHSLPDGLKDILKPILKEYQEKLFCQLKSL